MAVLDRSDGTPAPHSLVFDSCSGFKRSARRRYIWPSTFGGPRRLIMQCLAIEAQIGGRERDGCPFRGLRMSVRSSWWSRGASAISLVLLLVPPLSYRPLNGFSPRYSCVGAALRLKSISALVLATRLCRSFGVGDPSPTPADANKARSHVPTMQHSSTSLSRIRRPAQP